MINKYFFAVHNTDDSICGIKRYRGLVDLDDSLCFSPSTNHRYVRVADEEWFKIAELEKYANPDVYRNLDLDGKCIAHWNFIKNRVMFNPVVVATLGESDRVEADNSSLLTTTKNHINFIDGDKTHRIAVNMQSVDRMHGDDDLPLRVSIKYRMLLENKYGVTTEEKTLIVKKNTEHELAFEKSNTPCKIRVMFSTDTPNLILSRPFFFMLEYK